MKTNTTSRNVRSRDAKFQNNPQLYTIFQLKQRELKYRRDAEVVREDLRVTLQTIRITHEAEPSCVAEFSHAHLAGLSSFIVIVQGRSRRPIFPDGEFILPTRATGAGTVPPEFACSTDMMPCLTSRAAGLRGVT